MKPVLYLDHDVHLYFVAALRRRGYEASTTQEHGNQRLSDAEQLAFAAERDWTILSYNMGDFNALHTEWIAQGKKHAGILLASQFHPPRTLQRLLNLLFLADAADLTGNILFLGPWLDM